ncbi:MAG: HAD-IB family phosphatase [Verrucomicrobiota bacterium]
MTASPNWVFFDCDSTLSAMEGVDELARLRSPEILAEVEGLTHQAMNGEISLDEVFGRRMDLVRPSRQECQDVGRQYIETVESSAKEVLQRLRDQEWNTVILSGGFVPVIRPLAEFLGVERIEAVDLQFDEQGRYVDFERAHPNTRNGGKPKIIARLREEWEIQRAVMVGDGISDLETRDVVELFVGFGGFVEREKVRTESSIYLTSLADLPAVMP